MKIWTKKYLNLCLIVDPPYSIQELATFQHLKDSPPKGFAILLTNLTPYDTESDPQLKDSKKRKAVDEFLKNHPRLGVDFEEYDPKQERAEISVAELEELREKAKIAEEATT